ncbi:hypothetical protein CPB84DRAFT_1683732 [Gymnopilus junonius]|uniref:Uncharacterized protein n=1 Tax=Gymnopilus junonius TaxID=109634 RepID=A0A9P5NGL2_GYMJU|nr:hypothetical protein CPB84DRAFT_1683732 [Gymnopilus junonius]
MFLCGGKKGPLLVMECSGGEGSGMNSKRYREQVFRGGLFAVLHSYEVQEETPSIPAKQCRVSLQEIGNEVV